MRSAPPERIDTEPVATQPPLRVLGPVEIGSPPVRLGRGLLTRVFGVLLVSEGTFVEQERLTDLAWGADFPSSARTQVHGYVSRLRRSLQGIEGVELATRGGGYIMSFGPRLSDAGILRLATSAASTSQALLDPNVSTQLVSALALWRGQPFAGAEGPGSESGDPISLDVIRLENTRLEAVERLALARLIHGDSAAAARLVEKEALAHFERESLVCVLMTALQLEGKILEVAETVRKYEFALAEHGLRPSRRFREVHGLLLRDESALEAILGERLQKKQPTATLAPGVTRHPVEVGSPTRAVGLDPASTDTSAPYSAVHISSAGEVGAVNLRAPVAGRDVEIATFMEGWRNGRVVAAVRGEEGAGKTTLVDEIAQRVRSTGGRVLYGRCREELGIPYEPIVDALRRVAEEDKESFDLVELLTSRNTMSERGGIQRAELFSAISSGLARLAGEGQVLLVVEDLHWATADTCLLLRALAGDEGARAVSMAWTFRPELVTDHPLHATLAAAVRLSGFVSVSVGGLDRSAVRGLLSSSLSERVLDDDPELLDALAAAVHERTEGHALFVREIVGHLASATSENDLLAVVEDLPSSARIEALTARRLSGLSAAALDLVAALACAGLHSRFSLVRTVLPQTDLQLLDALDELCEVGLVVAAENDLVAFTHQLFRRVVTDRVAGPRRAALHYALSQAMKTRRVEDPSAYSAAEIAGHMHLGGALAKPGEAPEWALVASLEALERSAFADALTHSRLAQEWLPQGAAWSTLRARGLLAQREAQARGGDIEAAKFSAETALTVAREAQNAELMTEAAQGHASYTLDGAPDERSLSMLESTHAELAGHPELQARLSARRASHLALWGAAGIAALPAAEVALETAKATGDRVAQIEARWAVALSLLGTPHADRRTALAHELLELGEAHRDDEAIALGFRVMIPALMQRGEGHLVDVMLDRGYRHARRSHSWALEVDVARWRATQALALGATDQAQGWVDEHARLGRGVAAYEVSAAAQRLFLAIDERKLGELDDYGSVISREHNVRSSMNAAAAWMAALQGDAERARQFVASSRPERLPTGPDSRIWFTHVALLAEVAGQIDDADLASFCEVRLAPFAGQMAIVSFGEYVFGATDRLLGVCARVLGRADEAEAWFERALVLEVGCGWQSCVAKTQAALRQLSSTPAA